MNVKEQLVGHAVNNLQHYVTDKSPEMAITVGKTMITGGAVAAVGSAFGLSELEWKALGILAGIVVGIAGVCVSFYFQNKKYKLEEQIALNSHQWDGVERRVNRGNSKINTTPNNELSPHRFIG